MTLTFTAVYDNGVLRPKEPLPIEEGAEVRGTVENGEHRESRRPDQPSRFTYGLIGWAGDVKELDEYLQNPDDSEWEDE